jgi:hypothetical protein
VGDHDTSVRRAYRLRWRLTLTRECSEPFPEFDLWTAAKKIVSEHLRLPIPERIPPQFKVRKNCARALRAADGVVGQELMTLCWADDPADRPNFSQIGELLEAMESTVSKF